jgi:hypothetical protein
MADRAFRQNIGTLTPGLIILSGYCTTTTSGTLATTSTSKQFGFSVAKTAAKTGRYTITLQDPYTEFVNCNVTLTGPADVIWTANKGQFLGCRNLPAAGVKVTTFDIQFGLTADATHTDTEIADGAAFYLTILLKNSNVER